MQTRFVSSIILSAMLNIHTTTELKTLEPPAYCIYLQLYSNFNTANLWNCTLAQSVSTHHEALVHEASNWLIGIAQQITCGTTRSQTTA
jgi:hypothetical protein